MLPIFVISQFGAKRGPDVYSVMFTNFGVGNTFNLFVVKVFLPYIGFSGLFIVGGCFTITAALINLFLNTDPYVFKKDMR
jgi:hypothetical protein